MEKTLPLVTFEQAQGLKKAGFDWNSYSAYNEGGRLMKDIGASNHNWFEHNFSAPTVALALMYLREVKGLHGAVNLTHDGWYWQIINAITGGCHKEESFIDTHALAESQALTHILNILNQEK